MKSATARALVIVFLFSGAATAAVGAEAKAADEGAKAAKSSKVEEAKAKVIAGWLEMATLPVTGWVVKAKLDSGAKTSSIHATNIKEFKRGGKRWVRFDLHSSTKGEEPVTIERRQVRRVRIKDHDDPATRRSVVELEICFDGRLYKPQFTLADRGNFHYPVLLGRRFLAGVAVVDPGEKYLTSPACPEGEAKD
jgi:hypothetical protein